MGARQPVGPASGPWASSLSSINWWSPQLCLKPPAQVLRQRWPPNWNQKSEDNPALCPKSRSHPRAGATSLGGRMEPQPGEEPGNGTTARFGSHFPLPHQPRHTQSCSHMLPRDLGWLHLWRIDTSIHRGNTIHSVPAYGSFFLRERTLVLSHLVKQNSMWFPWSPGPEPETMSPDLPPIPPPPLFFPPVFSFCFLGVSIELSTRYSMGLPQMVVQVAHCTTRGHHWHRLWQE